MVWMEPRQAVPQPSGRRALESWDGVLKVRPVFRTQIPRLVQELYLRRQVSCAVGRGAQDGFERASNRGLAPKYPVPSIRIIEQKLELPMGLADAPAPQGIDHRARFRAERQPREHSVLHLEEFPRRQRRDDPRGISTPDPEIEILVRPGLGSHEQVDRPAARDPPGRSDRAHDVRRGCRLQSSPEGRRRRMGGRAHGPPRIVARRRANAAARGRIHSTSEASTPAGKCASIKSASPSSISSRVGASPPKSARITPLLSNNPCG
jgi:hypothetical protein